MHVAAASEAVSERDGVLFESTSSLAADTGLPLVFTSNIGSQTNYGVASIAGRKENATSGQAGGYLQFATGNAAGAISEKMRIDSSGNVGIGTTNPGTALEVYRDSIPAIKLNDGGDYQAYMQLAGNDLEIKSSSGQLEFYTGSADGASSTKRLTITSTGNAEFGGSISIDANNSLTFGNYTSTTASSAKLWNNNSYGLYVNGLGDSTHRAFAVYKVNSTAGYKASIFHDGSASFAASNFEVDATGQLTIKKSTPYTDPSFRILDRNNSNANGVLMYGNGSATFAGNACIGGTTVTDSNLLNLQGSSASVNVGVVLNDTNASKIYGIQNGNSALKFFDYTASTERMRIDSSGNVGIGTTNPVQQAGIGLHIHNASNQARIKLTQSGSGATANDGFDIIAETGNEVHLINHESAALKFGVVDEKMRIDSSGRVLINNTNADQAHPLQVTASAGTAEAIVINARASDNIGELSFFRNDRTTRQGEIQYRNDHVNFRHRSGDICFAAGGVTESMRIDSSGRLLLGTTTEGAADADNFTIADSGDCGITIRTGTTSTGAIYFSDATSGAAEADGFIDYNQSSRYLRFGTAQSERMRINSDGEVGIGTTDPARQLEILHPSNIDKDTLLPLIRLVGQSNTENSGNALSAGIGIEFCNKWNGGGSTAPFGIGRIGARGSSSYDGGLQFDVAQNAAAGQFNYVTAMTILKTGKVGIGTAAPGGKLSVFDDSTAVFRLETPGVIAIYHAFDGTDYTIGNNDGSAGHRIIFGSKASGAESGRFDSNGNLLVNFTDESYATPLVVGVTGTANSNDNAGSASSAFLRIIDKGGASNKAMGIDIRNHNSGDCRIVNIDANAANTAHMAFLTDTDSSTGLTEKMRITNEGNVGIGTTSPSTRLAVLTSASNTACVLQSTSANVYLQLANTGSGSGNFIGGNSNNLTFWTEATERMRISSVGQFDTFTTSGFVGIRNAATSTSNAAIAYLKGATDNTNGTVCFVVRQDGDVENTNNSYGSLSDVKLKENIVDANSQWSDIKSLQVRNYNFKKSTGFDTHTQIGVVAQEVETVSPGLVSESPDTDGEGNDLGTTTKSVNYSVLYMKAVKALQEAMERIESLETRIAALES